MSQQEDDLRALAKIMDFLRAVSIILVVMNVYWSYTSLKTFVVTGQNLEQLITQKWYFRQKISFPKGRLINHSVRLV